MVCVNRGVTTSTGLPLPDLTCDYSGCTDASGTRYASSALVWGSDVQYDCDGDGIFESGGSVEPVPMTEGTGGGACTVRDSGAPAPHKDAPMFGDGYAFLFKNESDYNALQTACTDADYQYLLDEYCRTNTEPVQFGVQLFDEFGNVVLSGCDETGCEYHICPSASAPTRFSARTILGAVLQLFSLR